MNKKLIAIIFTGLLSISMSAQAGFITTSGSISGNDGLFHTFNFSQDTAGTTQLNLDGNTDAYLYLFTGIDEFTSATYVARNDDGGPGLDSYLNVILGVGSYTAYITSHGTYWNGSSFYTNHDHLPMNYTLTINGSVSSIATSVAEPGTLALIGLGLIGVGLNRKRKTA